MLTILLDCTSHVTYCYGFVWCSMKSIRRVSLCNKTAPMAASLRIIINHILHAIYQTALQATSSLISEKRKFSLYDSFPCQTTQGRTRPQKRSLTEISEYAPHNQNEKHPIPLPTNSYVSPFHTNIGFLHACTPERLHAVRLHTGTQRFRSGNKQTVGYQIQKNISFKKNVQAAETVGNVASGAASEPHRFKYIVVGWSLGIELASQRACNWFDVKGVCFDGCMV